MAKERVLLGVILVLAAWVRLSGTDLGWFLQDQVRDGMMALGIVRGQEFPLVGPLAASSQVNLVGPLYYYLLAIPYGWSTNPAVGVAFLNLLNLISVYLTYRLGTEMFAPPVGLVAAALYGVFPMAVLSSKTLWNPGFIPFFTTLFLLTLWRYLVGRRPWTLTLLLVLLGVLLQIHASAVIFIVLLPLALLVYRPPLPRWQFVTGVGGIALLYAPYLWFEVQHGFPDAGKLLSWASKNIWGQEGQAFWVIAARGFWIPFLLPERMATALPNGVLPPMFPVAQRAELVLLGLGVLTLGALLVKARDRRAYIVLALWFILPFVVFPQNKFGVVWYHFDILYPAQFLVIGLLMQIVADIRPPIRLQNQIQNWLRPTLAVVVSGLVLSQIWFMTSFAGAVRRSGVLRFTTDILLSFPDPSWHMITGGILETTPLRFRRALAKRFVREFGADHGTLEQKAHGAVYQQFREDKGFSFLTQPPVSPSSAPDPFLHYVLLRDESGVGVGQGRAVTLGPYRILAYRPAVRYESWRWSVSVDPDWQTEHFDDSSWASLTLPARQVSNPAVYGTIGYTRWSGKRVAFRGRIEVPSVGGTFWLVLNIRHDRLFPHEVGALYLNGQRIEAVRTVSYDTVDSGNMELRADVTWALRPGSNLVALEVTGTNEEFDLDLYELRSAVGSPGS